MTYLIHHSVMSILEEKRPCPECDKTYRSVSGLRKHIRFTHRSERKHVCETCGKAFSQKTSLTQHRYVHTGEKPYACEIFGCWKRFSSQSSRIAHIRSHNKTRRYECPTCPLGFNQMGHLKTHVENVHQAKEKEHLCHICSSPFTYKRSLKKHLRDRHGIPY